MQARKLIDGASFGPDALKAIGQALTKHGQKLHCISRAIHS